MIFNTKKIYDPIVLVKLMGNWISIGSILQKKGAKAKMLMLGARLVEQVASEVFRSSRGWRPGVPRLGG